MHSEIRVRETQIYPRECEKQADMKDGMSLSGALNNCICMDVKKVQQLIKLKENEACEQSLHNNDRWCKNGKTHATLGKYII